MKMPRKLLVGRGPLAPVEPPLGCSPREAREEALPLLNAKLFSIFKKIFYFALHLQIYFQYLFAIPVSSQRGVTPFQKEILLANQPNFKFLLENLCHFIVILREDGLSRNQATCQRILRSFGKNCDF